METVLAFIPFILIVALLLLKVPAALSALTGIISVIVVSQIAFPIQPETFLEVSNALGVPAIEIIVILFSGVLLAETSEVVGAQKFISEWLVSVIGSRSRAILLVTLGLTPFLESSIGFSVGIIVVAPIIAKLGYSVTRTIALSVLGMFICPWGALGPGLIITVELTGIDMWELGLWSAVYSLPVIIIFASAAVLIAFPKGSRKQPGIDAFLMLTVLYVVLLLSNIFINTALSGVIASLSAIAFIMFRAGAFRKEQRQSDGRLMRYLSPYMIMIGGLFSVTLIKNLMDIGSLERFLSSPALWLFLAAASSVFSFGLPKNAIPTTLQRTTKRWFNPMLTLLMFLMMGGMMNATGISQAIADAATHVGLWNLAFIPLIGTLSGFITASSSVVNAMFSTGTAAIADSIGFSTVQALSLQNVTAAAGTIASPTRIVIGLAALAGTVENPGQKLKESKVQQVTLTTNMAITGVMIAVAFYLWFV